MKLLKIWLQVEERKNIPNYYLKYENYAYQALHPIEGHMNIINAEVPSEKPGRKENRTYILNQRFGQLKVEKFE